MKETLLKEKQEEAASNEYYPLGQLVLTPFEQNDPRGHMLQKVPLELK